MEQTGFDPETGLLLPHRPKPAPQLSDAALQHKGQFIYCQTIYSLHEACPKNLGDWYFTGDYPTPGGNRVVNRAFINFYEGKNERAY